MKKHSTLLAGLLILILAIGCMAPSSPKVPKWPFDNVTLKAAPVSNKDIIPGTYVRQTQPVNDYELISLREDGSAFSVPYGTALFATSYEPVKEGTWVYDKESNGIVIRMNGGVTAGAFKPLLDNGKKIGFAFYDASGYIDAFIKISDVYINTDIYKSNVIEGLFAAEDNYGDLYGWEFRKDGTATYYSDRKSYSYTYRTNPGKALIQTIDSMDWKEEYNYSYVRNTLIINGVNFQRIR